MKIKVFKIILILLATGLLSGCSTQGYLTDLEEKLEEYQTASEEANNNIEEANSIIEEAQGHAWESYQEMGEALENLETVEIVSEP